MENVANMAASLSSVLEHEIWGQPLNGKKCDSLCGSTWDVICYWKNSCFTHWLKLVMVATLVYLVILFFSLLFNLGICQYIGHSICRIIWACFSSYASFLDLCCTYLCSKLRTRRIRTRRRRMRDIEEGVEISPCTGDELYEVGETSVLPHSTNLEHGRSRFSSRRDEHVRRFLMVNNHHSPIKVAVDNIFHLRRKKNINKEECNLSPITHQILIARSSKFAHKGSLHRSEIHHKRKKIVRSLMAWKIDRLLTA